jgi:hypothetical protein
MIKLQAQHAEKNLDPGFAGRIVRHGSHQEADSIRLCII